MTLFSQPATTCADYPITNYTVHLNTTLTNATTSHTLNPDLPLRLQLNSTNGLVKDTHYIYYITAENRAGTGVSQSKEMGKYSNEEGTGQEEQYIIIQSGIVGLEYLEKECSLIICFTEMYIIYIPLNLLVRYVRIYNRLLHYPLLLNTCIPNSRYFNTTCCNI